MNKAYLTILFAQVLILSGCASLDSHGCPRVSTTLTAKDDGKSGSGGGATFIRVNPDTVKVAGSGTCDPRIRPLLRSISFRLARSPG